MDPSIKSKFKLHSEGCENLVILPLYPQYAALPLQQYVMRLIDTMNMRWQPSLKIILIMNLISNSCTC